MADMSVQTIAPTGVVPSYTAAANGDTIPADDSQQYFLHVKNGGGSSINVTIPAQETSRRVAGIGVVAIPDLVVAVANGAEKMIGPFSGPYINAAGKITTNYSAVTSVTVAALKLAKVG